MSCPTLDSREAMLTQHAKSAMSCLHEAKEAIYRQYLLAGPLQRQRLRLAGPLVKLQRMVTQQAAGAPVDWTDLPWAQLHHLADALSLQKKLLRYGSLTGSLHRAFVSDRVGSTHPADFPWGRACSQAESHLCYMHR